MSCYKTIANDVERYQGNLIKPTFDIVSEIDLTDKNFDKPKPGGWKTKAMAGKATKNNGRCICGAEKDGDGKSTWLAPQLHHRAGEKKTEPSRSTRCTQPRNNESSCTHMGAGCALLPKRFSHLFKCIWCA